MLIALTLIIIGAALVGCAPRIGATVQAVLLGALLLIIGATMGLMDALNQAMAQLPL